MNNLKVKNNNIFRFQLILLFLIIFCNLNLVSALTPQEVLSKFNLKMSSLKKYTVETAEDGRVIGPQGIQESSSFGKTFVKGNKRCSEVTIKQSETFGRNEGKLSDLKQADSLNQAKENRIIQIFDGTFSWAYDVAKKEVTKVDFSKLPAKIQEKIKESQDNINFRVPADLEFNMEEKSVAERNKDGKEQKKRYYVLTSTNTVTVGGQKYDKVILWIDAKEYLPLKVQWYGKILVKIPQTHDLEIQTQVYQKFKNWKFDEDIPDSKFIFTVPEGVKVVENTDKTKVLYEKYLKNI